MELANLNLCKNLDTLINNIQGIDKESASPSDIWFITFKPGTTFNGKPVDTGVIKIYFSPHNTFPIQDEFTDYLKGLEYEASVYEKIIDPLVVKRLCPFFITMFGRGKDCSFDDVVHILYRGVGDLSQAEKNLTRNFQMIWGDIPHIPAITRDRNPPIPSDVKINVIDKDFSFMLLRKFTTIHYSLRDYMRSVRSYDESKFWLILFQVCVGLYALELSKTVHNDLHSNNIVIEELDRPEEIIQFIEDENSTPTAYKFTTKYRTVIFDFDRAYAMQLGNNDLLDIYCTDQAGHQCNHFIKNRDVVQLFCKLMTEKSLNPRPLLEVVTRDFLSFVSFTETKRYCTSYNIPPGVYDLPRIILNCAERAYDHIETSQRPEQIRQWHRAHPDTFFHLFDDEFDGSGKYRGPAQ